MVAATVASVVPVFFAIPKRGDLRRPFPFVSANAIYLVTVQ